jgi:hypothetical protein
MMRGLISLILGFGTHAQRAHVVAVSGFGRWRKAVNKAIPHSINGASIALCLVSMGNPIKKDV